MLKISTEEFKIWAQYIYSISGIDLDISKSYLLETRFLPLLQETGSNNFSELYFKVKADVKDNLRQKIINLITTNETLFFRDSSPFELLKNKIIPDLLDFKKQHKLRPELRIWSAACSTGQEVYSIIIALKELLGDLHKYNLQIMATDISNRVVTQASAGKFSKLEIARGLPNEMLSKYFIQAGEYWKIKDELRFLSTFKTMNLMGDIWALGKFDVIFCRNVAIYFNEKDKKNLFDKIAKMFNSGGALVIGSTESITGICPQFESLRYLRSVYYQVKGV
ncbi:MAG: protein-glutamate O-methyltransferase CheR [Oligoflexia bacterium]|nr:protein-glutamate O-methyltransferase CheR [Oligoflexia bacterium]